LPEIAVPGLRRPPNTVGSDRQEVGRTTPPIPVASRAIAEQADGQLRGMRDNRIELRAFGDAEIEVLGLAECNREVPFHPRGEKPSVHAVRRAIAAVPAR